MSSTTAAVTSYGYETGRTNYAQKISREKLMFWSEAANIQLSYPGVHPYEYSIPDGGDPAYVKLVLNFIEATDLRNPAEFTYKNLQKANPGVVIPNTFKAMVTFHAIAEQLDLNRKLKGTSLRDHILLLIKTKPLELSDFFFLMETLERIDKDLCWRALDQTAFFYTRESGLRKNWGKSIELNYLVSWCDKRGWGKEVREKIEKIEAPKRARKEKRGGSACQA